MSDIFFDYKKKKIWDDMATFMKICEYEDWDGEMCKTRIHTLTFAYRTYWETYELDAIPIDEPTTMPRFLASSSGVIVEGSEEPDSFAGENLATSDINMAEKILNSTHFNILSSAPSPDTNPAPSEQESSESSSSFYFKKSKKKKTKVNHEEWHDKLSQSINSFMTTQAQNDRVFKKLFGEKPFVESSNDDTIVIKVRNSGEPFLLRRILKDQI